MASENETPQKSWQDLTPDEKLEKRLEAWLSPADIRFISPEAEADYKARATRLMNAFLLRGTPDRVPVTPSLGGLAAAYCGYTHKDIMYDADKNVEVATKCTKDFQFDTAVGAGGAGLSMGEVGELVDEQMYKWPGHGVDDENTFQFVEGEYMMGDEYDALIQDPSDFMLRTYLPRIWGIAGSFSQLPAFANISEMSISRFGIPEVQESLKKLMQAGEKALAWQGKIMAGNRKITELGFPSMMGASGGQGHGGSTFDYLGDGLRGTRGIAMDMYRKRDKVLEALDAASRRKVYEIKNDPAYKALGRAPVAGFALHKGADGYMSEDQFKTFYWPTLRRVCMALIEEGFVVSLFAEGGYESRLEIIGDLPKGRAIWHFDRTDMAKAKAAIGDVACIQGNVPVGLIHSGTPQDVEAYCRNLIDVAGKGGGFIMTTGAGIDRNGNVENVRAMVRTAKEYGNY